MSKPGTISIRKTAIGILLLAVANYVSGRLSLLLAIPPGFASPIFAPAGIALAALLTLGPPLWPGVLLASYLFNLHLQSGTPILEATPVALSIAVGSTLQALVGEWLVRRVVGWPSALDDERSITGFMLLGGPASCLIAATWGVTTLRLAGNVAANPLDQWVTWWAGDTLGVLFLAPLLFVFLGEPRDVWRSRRVSVAVPLLVGFAAMVLLYVASSASDQSKILAEFERRTDRLADELDAALDMDLEVVHGLANLYAASESVEPDEFRAFVRRSFDRHDALRALESTPRIREEDREAFVARMRADGPDDFAIRRWTGSDWEPSTEGYAEEYFPVSVVEPVAGNEAAVGIDLGSHPACRSALLRARETGREVATEPISLAQTGDVGLLVAVPVYESGEAPDSAGGRLATHRGFVLGVYRIEDLVSAAIGGADDDLALRILDVTDREEPEHLFGATTPHEPRRGGFLRDRELSFAGRTWRMEFATGKDFVTGVEWHGRATMSVGLLFTSLLGAFLLLVTGRQGRVERLVDERSREVRELNERLRLVTDALPAFIAYVDSERRYRFNNAYYERLLGRPVDSLAGVTIDSVLGPDAARLRPVIDRVLAGEEVRIEESIVIDGRRIHIDAQYVPDRGADGTVRGFHLMAVDITDRRRLEDELRERNERLRLITDSVPIAIARVGVDQRYQFTNAAYDQLVGRSREELHGTTVESILGAGYSQVGPNLERALTGKEVRYHFRLPHEDDFLEIDVHYVPDRDEDGRVIGLYVLANDVTERHRAEELSRVLFEQSSEAHLIFSGDVENGAGILSCNRAAVEMLRAEDVQDVLGRHPAEFSPEFQPDGSPSTKKSAAMDAIARREGSHRFDWNHRRFDGEEFLCEVSLTSISLSTGPALLAVWHDISERQRHAAEREHQRRETQTILDHLTALVWFKDDQNTVLRVNQAVADALGRSREEVEGRSVRELYPNQAEAFHADDRAVLESGTARIGYVQRIDGPDGTQWIRTDKVPLLDDHGVANRILVVASDITDLKQAEEALAESETKFRGIFNQTFQFIGLMAPDGTLTDANRSSLTAAGIEPHDVIGRPFWETPWWTHSPELQERLRDATRRAAEGEFVRFEATHPSVAGEIHVDFSLKPIVGADGRVLYLIPEGRDVTPLKRVEAELARSNEELQQFAYVASHDLRSPLRAITNLASWIVEDAEDALPEESRDHLVRIQKQCIRMDGLLAGLLEYSRAGRKRYRIETVPVADVLEDVRAMLQPPEPFRIEWPDELPVLEVERSPLQRVFLNLIGNALKHRARDDGRVTVGYRDLGAGRVEFSITDDGPGIEPEYHAQVFEMFRTLKPRDEVEGSGMGLAIVAKLVEHEGGTIKLASEPGSGATFTFTWPRSIERAAAEEEPAATSAGTR